MIALINFKAYAEGTGKNAVSLAKTCASVAAHFPSVTVMLAVQAADVRAVSGAVSLPVLVQHVDGVEPGAFTGHVLVESVREAGAVGSLLNHSERSIASKEIRAAIGRLGKYQMLAVVCAKDVAAVRRCDKFGAQFLALEPPELIGGKVSVSSARPGLIRDAVSVSKTPVLVGAGVHSARDVRAAVKLGAKGILVASDVLKAKDARKELMDLLSGFEKPHDLSKSPL